MNAISRKTIATLAFGSFAMVAASQATADAVIFNTGVEGTATVALGVKDFGHLNTTVDNVATNASATGLAGRIGGAWEDATSPGCLCEGWGVAVNGTTSGYANVAAGSANLTLDSFASTGSTATSAVHFTSLPGLSVTHAYQPSASADLFEAVVTIANTTGSDVTDVTYRRAMDWDVPPTEFSEYVTIQGTGTTTLLKASGDNGFMTSNPLVTSGYTRTCPLTADFVDCGPSDHGAVFDFDFGTIADGEEYSFSIFYGASTSESAALAALGVVGAELYSFGQPSTGADTGEPLTFIFAFSGVGGTVIVPPPPTPGTPVNAPGALALMGLGLLGIAARRRKA